MMYFVQLGFHIVILEITWATNIEMILKSLLDIFILILISATVNSKVVQNNIVRISL